MALRIRGAYILKWTSLLFTYANFESENILLAPDNDTGHQVMYQKFYLNGNDLAKSICAVLVVILKTFSTLQLANFHFEAPASSFSNRSAGLILFSRFMTWKGM